MNGYQEIFTAIKTQNVAEFKTLMEKVIDINQNFGKKGHTLLMYASYKGSLEIVKLLLGYENINIDKKCKNGWDALMLASTKGHVEITKLLLDRGANFNSENEKGATALISAARAGSLETVALLLKKGADINHKTQNGFTALMWASCVGYTDVVRLLCEYNHEAESLNESFLLALREGGYSEIVKLLLKKGANILHQDKDGNNCLKYASMYFDGAELLKLLLQNDININQKYENGYTALIIASEYGHLENVKTLLDNGADANIQNDKGNTSLMIICGNMLHNYIKRDYLEIVKLLVSNNMDIMTIQNNHADTAFTLARKSNLIEIENYLLECTN